MAAAQVDGRDRDRSKEGGEARAENVRMVRFNEALNKFLELLDERATMSNFHTALPHLDEKLLDSARKQFVYHLKDAIKMEKDRLVENYTLGQRLKELQELTEEADERNDEAKKQGMTAAALHRDAWRPSIDLADAIHAPLVPQARQRIAALESELALLERDNDVEHVKLTQRIQEEESKRGNAKKALNLLEETLAGIESSTEEEARLKAVIDTLLAELGPRGIV